MASDKRCRLSLYHKNPIPRTNIIYDREIPLLSIGNGGVVVFTYDLFYRIEGGEIDIRGGVGRNAYLEPE